MSKPTPQPAEKNIITTLIRLMMLGAVLAMSYVILKSCSTPKTGIERFSEGSLKKLQVSETPSPAPKAIFKDADGREFSMADKKGKVVLLNIWATWCAPCIAEMPSLNALQARYDKSEFEIVTVSVDRNFEEVQEFWDEVDVGNLTPYLDNTYAIAHETGARAIPMTILYDQTGRELARINSDANWNSRTARALIDEVLGR